MTATLLVVELRDAVIGESVADTVVVLTCPTIAVEFDSVEVWESDVADVDVFNGVTVCESNVVLAETFSGAVDCANDVVLVKDEVDGITRLEIELVDEFDGINVWERDVDEFAEDTDWNSDVVLVNEIAVVEDKRSDVELVEDLASVTV